MKIGLIADPHANLIALEAVLKDMEPVDRIICAGDLIGYNPYPNETIALLMDKNVHCVAGEHDKAAVSGDTQWFNHETAKTLKWTIGRLDRENLRFLETLPDHIDLDGITVYHGNPNSIKDIAFEYDQEKMCHVFESIDQKIFVFGHTHIPVYKICGDRIILNPGSVGQPRDGISKASYAIYDTSSRVYNLHRVDYDIEIVQKQILLEGLPEIMAERLGYGR